MVPRARSLPIACVVAGLMAAVAARAQEPAGREARVHVPEGPHHVGDRVEIEIEVPLDGGRIQLAPQSDDADEEPGDLVVEARLTDELRIVVTAQAFRVGAHTIPPIPYVRVGPDGTEDPDETPAIELEVESVLDPEDERVPAGLAPPAEIAFPVERLVSLVAGGLLLLALAIGGLVWLLLRRGSAGPPPPPPVPADGSALAALGALLEGPLLGRGEYLRFHVELAAILKRYLEARYAFPAVERTTTEVDRDLKRLAVDPAASRPALDVLGACDAVKFARASSTEGACRALADRVREVVERTRPRAAAPGEDAA